MADIELNADPESTWGATEEYKAAWHAEYGKKAPSRSASKGEWVAWATDPVHGDAALTEEDADARTRDELVESFGGAGDGGIFSAPSAPNSGTPGQGAGTAPEGNVTSDPAVSTASTGTGRTGGGTSAGTTTTR